jgi:hypothetical protein
VIFSSCRLREDYPIYHIIITNSQGIVLFEKEGILDYISQVKTFNGEAYANIRVYTGGRTFYEISGVGIQVTKEYVGLKSSK